MNVVLEPPTYREHRLGRDARTRVERPPVKRHGIERLRQLEPKHLAVLRVSDVAAGWQMSSHGPQHGVAACSALRSIPKQKPEPSFQSCLPRAGQELHRRAPEILRVTPSVARTRDYAAQELID